jgi:hypothetical protein
MAASVQRADICLNGKVARSPVACRNGPVVAAAVSPRSCKDMVHAHAYLAQLSGFYPRHVTATSLRNSFQEHGCKANAFFFLDSFLLTFFPLPVYFSSSISFRLP